MYTCCLQNAPNTSSWALADVRHLPSPHCLQGWASTTPSTTSAATTTSGCLSTRAAACTRSSWTATTIRRSSGRWFAARRRPPCLATRATLMGAQRNHPLRELPLQNAPALFNTMSRSMVQVSSAVLLFVGLLLVARPWILLMVELALSYRPLRCHQLGVQHVV